MFRKHDNDLFPYDSSLEMGLVKHIRKSGRNSVHLSIIDVVDLVKDYKFHISNKVSSFV